MNTLENIEIVVETPVVVLIEDLHPHESIEDEGRQLILFADGLVREDNFPSEIEYERHGELEDGLANNHLPHCYGDQRR